MGIRSLFSPIPLDLINPMTNLMTVHVLRGNVRILIQDIHNCNERMLIQETIEVKLKLKDIGVIHPKQLWLIIKSKLANAKLDTTVLLLLAFDRHWTIY